MSPQIYDLAFGRTYKPIPDRQPQPVLWQPAHQNQIDSQEIKIANPGKQLLPNRLKVCLSAKREQAGRNPCQG